MNENIFEKIIFSTYIRSKNSSKYIISSQAYSGTGYLDIIIYFGDRADLYELKFELEGTIYNLKKNLEAASNQIYNKNYM